MENQWVNHLILIHIENSHQRSACMSYIISYHIMDLKWQNHLKVGTVKPKLKAKM